MNTMKKTTIVHLSILILILAASSNVWAHEVEREPHVGFFLGLNAGVGGGSIHYTDGDRSIMEDPTGGAFGAFRIGYAVSESFAISLENFGFGTECEEEEWGIGASMASITWHPGGSGFFLRTGVGGGGGHYTHPDDGLRREVKDQLAYMFGLGYDFRLSNKFALGICLDSFSMNADDSTGYEDDQLGAAALSIQLNWFL